MDPSESRTFARPFRSAKVTRHQSTRKISGEKRTAVRHETKRHCIFAMGCVVGRASILIYGLPPPPSRSLANTDGCTSTILHAGITRRFRTDGLHAFSSVDPISSC